ncbi:MAG: exodeoxyribonuclease III [Gammaproteobacteria bacterium]|nr:exodeoxyribonuclease III [Gammaproteobacteria bacterium]
MQVATWNINSLRVRLPQVLAWLETSPVDILGLQETKLQDADFPQAELEAAGYQVLFSGQRTYNGVAVVFRNRAMTTLATSLPGLEDPQRRVLCAADKELCFLNLYIPNGAEVGSDKYDYKLKWLAHLQGYVTSLLADYANVIVTGDFNIAPEDRDVHDPEAWRDKVLFSEPEKAEFRKLIDHGLVDCYRLFDQPDGEYTWWDYRAAGFRRNRGLRIDHILASRPLAERCRSCHIDKAPRASERPSDHTPVVAEFNI